MLLVVCGLAVASGVGVAQSDAIDSEAAYVAAMKEIGATCGSVQSEMDARRNAGRMTGGSAHAGVLAGTAHGLARRGAESRAPRVSLTELFGQVQAFWQANGIDEAAGIAASQAAEAASAITTAVETQAFQEIAPASAALGSACQSCHTEYREPVDGGGFRIKPGVL